MGQRHQAFLITRICPHSAQPSDPGQRRCIAAFYHQWCYGMVLWHSPTGRLASPHLITLMSHPENAAMVRAELRAIDGQYRQHSEEEPMIPDIPCPYAVSLLASAYTTDLDEGREIYSSGGTAEQDIYSTSMSCWGGRE
ncbi:hypothetical protein LXA43DRAFT_906063 [Ganoderma leucocontextum]|nr:hypothetical protein LXA43DRAFT_906063 [Ganoderma leucocontextum]